MSTALLKGKMLVFVVIYGFRCKESNLLRQTVSVIRNLDSPFDNLASSGKPVRIAINIDHVLLNITCSLIQNRILVR